MIGSNTTTARVRLALEGQGQVVRGLQEVQAGVGSLRSAFTSIAGGLSLGAAVGQLVQVQREMDVLNASMITVTGSSRAAGTEMEWIKRFAAQTPYQLNEVTGAFVKMKALGLDASEKALRSYGNTASAMGKDLTQFIEAVADAATGEFERLKEFGIKAKKEGDSVALNFQGVTTRVRNNAADITAYLQAIGNNEFAGAADRRMQTLDGKIATLAKSWRDLAATVNEAGVGNLIETSVRGATAAISGLGATIRENKTELAVLAGGLGGAALVATLPKVGAGLMIVAGGVKALGLALAANPLVLALLGIGAAVGAAAAYSKVQSGTVESMARTVKELEALNARAKAEPWDAVLNANVEKRNQQIADLKKRMTEMGQAARDAFALTDPRRTGEVTEEINRIAPVISDATASGLDPKNPKGKPVRDALDRMAMYSAEVQGEFRQLVIDKEAQWAAEALKQELQSNEVESFFRQVEIEAEARWQAQQDRARSEAEEAADRLRAKELAEWERANEQIAQSLTDSLMQGGRSFRDYLKDLFRTLVLRPIIAPVGAALASMFGGPAAAGQGGSSLGSLGSLSSLQNLLNPSKIFSSFGDSLAFAADSAGQWLVNNTSGYLNQLGGQLMGNAGTIGTIGSYAGGAMAGLGIGKAISGGYSAFGSSGNTAVNAGTIIGSIFGGPVGGAIGGAIGGAVNRLFGRKAPVTTSQGISGTFGVDGANVQQYQDWFSKGGVFRSNKSGTNYSAVSAEMDSFLDAALVQVASTTRSYAQLMSLNADAINGITQSVKINLQGLNAQQQEQAIADALSGFGSRLAQELLGTFETTVTQRKTFLGRVIEKSVTTWVAGPFVRAGETAGEALARLGTALGLTNTLFDTLGTTLFAASLQGADYASSLVDAFGGLENLQNATMAYYGAFYSEQERTKTATRQLTTAMRELGLQMPESREAFRALVESQDLMTEHGRALYATLVQLAPVFDEITTATHQLAEEAAKRLIASFTRPGGVLPALSDMRFALTATASAADEFTGPVSTIHRLLGDASSGVLTFGERVQATTSALNPAQLAVQALHGEIFTLRTSASGTVVDIAGLSAALANVNTETFVATVTGVFELIGQRVKDTLAGIANERAAVREAAMGIIAPGVMSAQQIRAGISESMVNMPGTGGIASAQQALANADAAVKVRQQALGSGQALLVAAAAANQAQQDALKRAQAALASTPQTIQTYIGRGGFFGTGSKKYRTDPNPAYAAAVAAVNSQTVKAAEAAKALAAAQASASTSAADLTAAQAAQKAAAAAAQQAQLDYVATLQKYSLDASKAVSQLGRLREETVKYYQQQEQLASLMNGTAAGLRNTVAQFRFDQLDPAAQLAQLQERYNVAYSMAMSTQGETLASYGQELNSLINPLLQKAQEAGLTGSQYANLVNTVLARAEATASRLDAFAPTDYQAESLGLLGQIDATLAALEKGAMTADQLIVQAIDAGRDTTRDGLRAVVAALTGQTVPAFAAGGLHSGGVRLVGEYGPELEVTGPSRIYSASQTARMLGGGNSSEVVAELRAMRAELAQLRQDNQVLQAQVANNTGRTARQLDRWDTEGAPVRNADGETLAVATTEGAVA